MSEYEKDIICKNTERIHITVDDYVVRAFNAGGEEIGRMEFYEIENDRGPSVLKLSWAYLDKLGKKYVHQGIGRECLKAIQDTYGLPIAAEIHDGVTRDDGSHLTGDAPTFVEKMRAEGLILPAVEEDYENGEDHS